MWFIPQMGIVWVDGDRKNWYSTQSMVNNVI